MSSLPPPPKMSGLTTPSSSSGATSFNRFHTPTSSTSRYQTPPPPQTSFSSNSKSKSNSNSNSSSSSDFLSTSYENFAPRSAEQRSRLARIASLTAGPYHSSPQDGEETKEETPFPLSTALCPPKPPSLDPLQILHRQSTTIAAATPSDHPTAILATTLRQTHRTTASLATLLRSTASLRLALRASLNIANDLTRRHADLLRHSGELSAAAERLQHEEAVLARRAEEIGRPLKHYDDVDGIGALVGLTWSEGGRVARKGAGRVDVDEEEEFLAVLVGVDEAMEFFGEGVEGEGRRRLPRGGEYDAAASGGAEYFRRACALQDAALELLRVAVADRISVISTQIQDALNLPKVPLKADKLEASLVYTRFHGISKRSNKLITVARRRLDALGDGSVAAVGYEDLLTLCRNTYCGAREVLLTSTVRNHMDILKERHGLVGMTRLASVFLIRLCTVETALYLDFFGDPDKRRHPRKALKGSVQTNDEGKSEEGDEADEDGNQEAAVTQQQQHNNNHNNNKKLPAAATLASQILSEDSTFRDAEFQSMLGGLCSSLHRTIRRGLVSILDLDVLCQVVSVLREERAVANKSPTTMAAARAVSGVIQDAQERLIFCANTALHKEVVRFKPTPADLNYPGKLLGEKPKAAIVIEDDKTDSKEPSTEEHKEEAKDASATSDPNDAVAAQLRVYESWFPPMRSVLRILSKIFRVVEPRVFEDIALQSVQSCTKSLKEGSVYILRASGQIHADLFLVKHLLILREQLSPFDIQLRSVERQLDFSEAGKAVSRFLANRNRRLFSMSTENALITLLREGVSVQESSVDSKRDLEDCLRSACNDFIEHTSSSLLGPIAIFVDQCKNAVGSGSGSTDVLIKAPFMNAVLVKGVFSKALENLDGALENVSKQMHLYLENTATQSILMKPVVRKMTRSLEEARRFVGEVPDGANNWEEGAKEEVLKISEEFETKVKSATSKHGTR